MITLLTITTAVCFVAAIWSSVQVVVLQRNADRLLRESSTLREILAETRKERDDYSKWMGQARKQVLLLDEQVLLLDEFVAKYVPKETAEAARGERWQNLNREIN